MTFWTYAQFVLMLIIVIGMILGLAWVVKRFGLTGALQGSLGRKRRLGLVESATLDGRNRVILLRRDNVEHLVLVGPNTSQVIESGIPAQPVEPGAENSPASAFPTFTQFLSKDKEP